MKRPRKCDTFTCEKCLTECVIEYIDHNDFACFCDVCNDYAEGFDSDEYYINLKSGEDDWIYEQIKDENSS